MVILNKFLNLLQLNKKNYSTKLKLPNGLYLNNANTANKIAKQISEHLKKLPIVIEINPGLGLLTKKLIKNGVNKIYGFESIFTEDKHKSCEDIFFKNLETLHGYFFNDVENIKKYFYFMNDQQPWTLEAPSYAIVGTVTNRQFLKFIINSIIFQDYLFNFGRPALYVTVPALLYHKITATPQSSYHVYRSFSVLFQLLFDIKFLEKYPRACFSPNAKTKRHSATYKEYYIDIDWIYLIELTAKAQLPVDEQHLKQLWFFLHTMMTSRTSRVIPSLEKFIPSCGEKIILKNDNINIFTEFGELTPEEILDLFNEFVNFKEYPHCSFASMFEDFSLQNSGDDDNKQSS